VESRNLAADAAAGAAGGYRGAADAEAAAQKAMRLLSRRNLDAERLGQDVHALELQVNSCCSMFDRRFIMFHVTPTVATVAVQLASVSFVGC
jgi:hypothetical protein